LFDNNDVWVSDVDGMKNIVSNYITNLFTSSNPTKMERVTDLLPRRVMAEHNEFLMKPLTKLEVYEALMDMDPSKAPGPDGMSLKFFQFLWDTVGDKIFIASKNIFKGKCALPADLNHTNRVLIPKCQHPKCMGELRPISLCNVLYRIFSKVLANRLKHILPHVISDNQSAFVPGRLISDNLLVASEILHYMKRKNSGRRGWMASKIDMSKAFDRMEWSYLEIVLLQLGFHGNFVSIIMQCVMTVTYSVQLNGENICNISPTRGLRQGDPLSPYLFILGLEGLSALFGQAEVLGGIHGIKVCRNAPPVSLLLFADDCFAFCEASVAEAGHLKTILRIFEEISGQQVNLAKSSTSFTKNISAAHRRVITHTLGFNPVSDHGKYLGFPSSISPSKNACFNYLNERVWQTISNWDSKTLSQAGRTVLIKAVASAIPTYVMGVAYLPDGICDTIEKMLNGFLWKSSLNGNGLRWLR